MQAVAFRALGEPNRLRIVEMLRTGPYSVGEIVDQLDIRQPQVSKHLRVLSEAGLVTGQAVARHRIYRLSQEPFDHLATWIDSFEHLWETRLDSLGDYLTSITDQGSDDGNQG